MSKHRDKQGSAEVRIKEGGMIGEDFRVRRPSQAKPGGGGEHSAYRAMCSRSSRCSWSTVILGG